MTLPKSRSLSYTLENDNILEGVVLLYHEKEWNSAYHSILVVIFIQDRTTCKTYRYILRLASRSTFSPAAATFISISFIFSFIENCLRLSQHEIIELGG